MPSNFFMIANHYVLSKRNSCNRLLEIGGGGGKGEVFYDPVSRSFLRRLCLCELYLLFFSCLGGAGWLQWAGVRYFPPPRLVRLWRTRYLECPSFRNRVLLRHLGGSIHWASDPWFQILSSQSLLSGEFAWRILPLCPCPSIPHHPALRACTCAHAHSRAYSQIFFKNKKEHNALASFKVVPILFPLPKA